MPVKPVDERDPRPQLVLDASVLIDAPEAPLTIADADVVIPLSVVEELDSLKGRPVPVGPSARDALRVLERLRQAGDGDLRTRTANPAGGTVRIEMNGLLLGRIAEAGLELDRYSNRVLAAALGLSDAYANVVMVSNDTAIRLKATQLGVRSEEFHRDRSKLSNVPDTLWTFVAADQGDIDALYDHDDHAIVELAADTAAAAAALPPNGFAVLRCGSQSVLTRRRGDTLHALPARVEAWGMRPRNKEQRAALDLLLDPKVRVVALDGLAGTGKSLLALAAGLEQVVETKKYDRVSVFRPIMPVGDQDLGFLPGDVKDKTDPFMAAILDAIAAMTERRSYADARKMLTEMTVREQLTMEPVTFLRGRTLHQSFILVDEAQNLPTSVAKTILTRVGEGTKVVFTGDTSQIDSIYLSERNNALTALIEGFTGEPVFGHVRLVQGERSDIADLAARRL